MTGTLGIRSGQIGVSLDMVNTAGPSDQANLVQSGSGSRRVRFGGTGKNAITDSGHFIIEGSSDGGQNYYEGFRMTPGGAVAIKGSAISCSHR